MDESLLRLMEELVETIELREAGDPDCPAWRLRVGSSAWSRSSPAAFGTGAPLPLEEMQASSRKH